MNLSKAMCRRIWVVVFIVLAANLVGSAQNTRNSRIDKKHEAVNSYIKFTNETIHLLWDLHVKLERFNKEANLYKLGKTSSLKFETRQFVNDFAFNSKLKAVCATKPAEGGILVDLRDLYEQTSVGNGYIPMPQRSILNKYRDELYFSLISVLGLTDSLSQYVRIRQYRVDKELTHVYGILKEMEKLYGEIQFQKDQMERLCQQLSEPIPPALKSLQNIMNYSREILIAVRDDQPKKLPQLSRMLQASVEVAERMKKNTRANLLGLDLYYNVESSGYGHMIKYAEQIQLRADEYTKKGWMPEDFEVYGNAYYFYNERMLAVFNHHKYGIAAYYNRFIGFANRVFVKELEEVPLFKVISPEKVQMLADKKNNTPGPNSLQGAASNNMVFLLDVSASMDRPEKLNLLKESISFLVDQMRPEDEVSIIIYSGDARVILNPTSALFKAEIKSAIKSMRPGGKTKAMQGLKEAYRVAERNFIAGGNNRIIMASDGAFDINDSILKYVGKKSLNSISLSVLLFNKLENIRVAEELTRLANRGGGNYSHVQPENAKQVLIMEANSVRRQ